MKIKIEALNPSTDISEIATWDKKYRYDPRYDSIREFILENNTYFTLREVLYVNYEAFKIGNNERKFAFTIKNQNNEIIGFVLSLVDNLQSHNSELMIQYLVINPEHQNKGVGKVVLNELINKPKKYFNTEIASVFAKVNYKNKPSYNLFKNFGFVMKKHTTNYAAAYYDTLEFKNE